MTFSVVRHERLLKLTLYSKMFVSHRFHSDSADLVSEAVASLSPIIVY